MRHAERSIGIDTDTTRRFRRRTAGDGVVQDGGGGVDVSPRPLPAVECILLDGRILRRQNAREGARVCAHRLTRRTEIDEDRHAVVPDNDVRRLDVAMQEALGMDGAQPAQQPLGEPAHLVGLQAAVRRAQQLRHAAAVFEFHDGIGRAVGFEVTKHRDDVGVAKSRQRPRLVEKTLTTPDEIVIEARPARRNLAAGASHGKLDRKVLLDGNELGELSVEGAVSDTESAVPDDRIESIVAEPRTERQSLIVFR